ncbi:hypothetical protein BLNAU_13931 [Blattamonas nauphoetae]|uniref:Uncharacterized protein n=1 Tax=Blattamonas nauphoetae TaxID=2049346 RepID=A0ABQ9XF57_9EUKA|nr:hypothetical protein BLNAU_13931 [Blattamonas nauphoetae]
MLIEPLQVSRNYRDFVMKWKLSLVKDGQRQLSSYLTQDAAYQHPNPDVEDRLEELVGILSEGPKSERVAALNILRINLTYPSLVNKLFRLNILRICCNLDALMSFLIALSGVVPRDYGRDLESSGFFNALFAQSIPSNQSLDRCLTIWEVWSHMASHASFFVSHYLFGSPPGDFVDSIIPFVQSKCVTEIRPGAQRVSHSFGRFEPLIQKIGLIPGIIKFRNIFITQELHSMTSFLCDLMGAESLETRLCVLQVLYEALYGLRLDPSLPGWLFTETTPFSVNSDGTLKEETLLGKLSFLLTESMNAIDTLLADVCDDNVKTLSNHCRLVASTFSCLALLGQVQEEPFEILMSKGVLQQIGAWVGALLEIPPSPTRNETVLSLVQILVDFQSRYHSKNLISLSLVFPDSSTPLADLLALIEPLITLKSDKAMRIIAQFLSPCSQCCKPNSGGKSLLFVFFNKFVDSTGFLEVDLEDDRFHQSIMSFMSTHLFTDDSSDTNPLDTPSLRAYLHQFLLSNDRTGSTLREPVRLFIEHIIGLICQNVTSLLFWKDVGGVTAIVHALTLEDRSVSSVGIFKAIYKKILFPEGSIMAPEQQTLVLRELEEEGFSDAVEMDADYLQRLPEWNVPIHHSRISLLHLMILDYP